MLAVTASRSHAVRMHDRELEAVQNVLRLPILLGLERVVSQPRAAIEAMLILGIEIGYSVRENQEGGYSVRYS